MPRALIAIVTIVAILYVVVALTLTGMLPLSQIHQEAPLAHAFSEKGSPTVALFVGAGAVGMTVANTFCAILTQPRIWLCMAEHGLLPSSLAEVSPPPRCVPTAGVLHGGLFDPGGRAVGEKKKKTMFCRNLWGESQMTAGSQ